MRDLLYEETFLRETRRRAEARHGVLVPADFERRVIERLVMGAQRYGDEDYLHKDVIKEIRFEAWDLTAYPMLQAQKQFVDLEAYDEVGWRLYEIACHAAAVDGHAAMLRSGG